MLVIARVATTNLRWTDRLLWRLIAASWTPHWMFARYELRFLDDPQGVFGGTERIHALARQGLDQQAPAVTDFLSRFHLPDSDLDGLLLKAQQSSAETAVQDYLSEHPQRVNYWTTGRI